jgi:hypothetical protein
MQRPKMTRIISFRVTEEDWFRLERAAADCGDRVPDWCRTITLETLKMPVQQSGIIRSCAIPQQSLPDAVPRTFRPTPS